MNFVPHIWTPNNLSERTKLIYKIPDSVGGLYLSALLKMEGSGQNSFSNPSLDSAYKRYLTQPFTKHCAISAFFLDGKWNVSYSYGSEGMMIMYKPEKKASSIVKSPQSTALISKEIVLAGFLSNPLKCMSEKQKGDFAQEFSVYAHGSLNSSNLEYLAMPIITGHLCSPQPVILSMITEKEVELKSGDLYQLL